MKKAILNEKDGKVAFLMKTGNDFVKNYMPIKAAQDFVDKGEVTISDRADFPIKVDDRYYFDGKFETIEVETPVVEQEEPEAKPIFGGKKNKGKRG